MNENPDHLNIELLLDKRVRQANLDAGALSPEQVHEYLEALTDSEDKAEYVDLPEMESTEGAGLTRKPGDADDDAQEELLTDKLSD